MGTNYYKGGVHLGKRSAAGMYCYDCGITLCKGGRDKVHDSVSPWHDACPVCGKEPINETLNSGAVARELGFYKGKLETSGVHSCCSFSWAVEPAMLKVLPGSITSEYGDKFTVKEFKELTNECVIQYFHSIGQDFC